MCSWTWRRSPSWMCSSTWRWSPSWMCSSTWRRFPSWISIWSALTLRSQKFSSHIVIQLEVAPFWGREKNFQPEMTPFCIYMVINLVVPLRDWNELVGHTQFAKCYFSIWLHLHKCCIQPDKVRLVGLRLNLREKTRSLQTQTQTTELRDFLQHAIFEIHKHDA